MTTISKTEKTDFPGVKSKEIILHPDNVIELKSEKDPEGSVREICQEVDVPLFLRDSSEGQKCNAQDEKDKTVE